MSKRVLFVCTGNTCRSPMAEGFARAKFEESGIDAIVESAGLHADGGTANEKSIVAAQALYGIDISSHRSRQLTAEMTKQADRIITMTPDQAVFLQQIFPNLSKKISSLTPEGIPDPYGGTEEDYLRCAERIYGAVSALTEDGTWN